MDLKRNFAYPASFWIGTLVIPSWSLVNIILIEVIFGQTTSFIGYSKYEMYILVGIYRLIVNIAYFMFLARLHYLKSMIRGDNQETFDMVLLKPIDSQLYATLGRFSFLEVSQIFVGFSLLGYGFYNEPHQIGLLNIVSFLILFCCGVGILYMLFLFLRTCIFWFQEFEVSEGLYETFRGFGRNPKDLYTGWFGLFVNVIFPVTLCGAIPVEVLLGKIAWYYVFLYLGITILFFFITRYFWFISIKKYASFSS